MSIECKAEAGGCGDARIGRVSFSKSGRAIPYQGLELTRIKGGGILGNYLDQLAGVEYWVSGPKRDRRDRHWAGSGPVAIDGDVVEEYWRTICRREAPQNPLVANQA